MGAIATVATPMDSPLVRITLLNSFSFFCYYSLFYFGSCWQLSIARWLHYITIKNRNHYRQRTRTELEHKILGSFPTVNTEWVSERSVSDWYRELLNSKILTINYMSIVTSRWTSNTPHRLSSISSGSPDKHRYVCMYVVVVHLEHLYTWIDFYVSPNCGYR